HRRRIIVACAGFHRLPNLVSVLVSILDPEALNSLQHPLLEMEPMAGIEPATDGLRNRCSTTELHWRPCSGPAKNCRFKAPDTLLSAPPGCKQKEMAGGLIPYAAQL